MLKTYLKTKNPWLPIAFLAVLSCSATAEPPQQLAPDSGGQTWPKEFEARDSRIVIYEPQLETFRGSRMTSRAAVSVTREKDSEPVFGGVWLDAVVSTDADRRTVTPVVIKVSEVRFPSLSGDEAARLRQDIGDEIVRWNLKYSVDALLAEVKLIEEQKAAAEGLKAEVPKILFRNGPAVLLTLEDKPAWGKSTDSAYQRLENNAAFVVRNERSGDNYLRIPPFWWTSTDLHGPWQPAETIPQAVEDQWKNEPQPQLPSTDLGPLPRPEVIPLTGAAELVWTDGAPQYAPIAGTDLLYVRNTESDVFLETRTQTRYALFSGRWYRSPQSKDAWEFVASDQLPADFGRIPITSEKRHVLACVAGTPQAREAVQNAEIPQTEAVKPGPAPDLQATYDGEPQFTDIPDLGLQYAVNTPYSIFHVPGRYYWCFDGIWYDSPFAVGPWYVCVGVPRVIYLIPPSCPHYYVTYCHIFGATPNAVYVGYYPGYRGCYAWHGSVVYGTGWHYRPWIGTHCYTRPVTWGLGVQYNPVSCGWSIRLGGGGTSVWGVHRPSSYRAPSVQAGAGGYWGGASARPTGVHNYRNPPAAAIDLHPRDNLYVRQPERLAPNPARPEHRTPTPAPGRDLNTLRAGDRTGPPPVDRPLPPHDKTPLPPPRTPTPPRDHRELPDEREGPRTPPPPPRDVPRTPPIEREGPRTPAPRQDHEVPRTPPPPPHDIPRTPPPPREQPAEREVPRTPPPRQDREAPRTPPPPPPPPREQREAPRTPPPQHEQREAPHTPPPPQHREPQKDSSNSSDRRR